MSSRSINDYSRVVIMGIIVDATDWSIIAQSRVITMTTLESSFTIVIMFIILATVQRQGNELDQATQINFKKFLIL